MEGSDLIPASVNIRNDVPFRNLLVIDILHDLAGRAVDRLADLIGLGNADQEQPAVVPRIRTGATMADEVPARPTRRASSSDTASAANEIATATSVSRTAAASPPGVWVRE